MSKIELIKQAVAMPDLLHCREGSYVPCPDVRCPSRGKGDRKTRIHRDGWHCFRCAATGNVFDWLMLTRGYTFKEALHELAMKAGIELTANKERSQALKQVVLAANRYLMARKDQLRYMHEARGLSWGVILRQQLGYLDADGEVLAASGVDAATLLALGLLAPSRYDASGYRSVMAERYLVPVRNKRGEVVQLKGRLDPSAHPGSQVPKSLCLAKQPEAAPKDWGAVSAWDYLCLEEHLYQAEKAGFVVLCEGELDALTVHDWGLPAVGLPGNEGLEGHLYKFKNVRCIYDARDNDEATEAKLKAQLYSMQIALPHAVIKRVQIPHLEGREKVDVNDLKVRFGYDKADFQQLLDTAVDATELIISWLSPDYGADKQALAQKLFAVVPPERKQGVLQKLADATALPIDMLAFGLDPKLLQERPRAV
jgi:DNA primase